MRTINVNDPTTPSVMRKTASLFVLLSTSISLQAQVLCVNCYDQVAPINPGGVNLIVNGSFESHTCTTWPNAWDVFCPASSSYVCDVANWVCAGGGTSTYSLVFDNTTTTVPDGLYAVYLGNAFTEFCSPVVDDTSCLVTSGCVVTGIPPGYPQNDPAYGGNSGVTLSQTVPGLTIGGTYILEFWAGGENFPNTGVFGVDVGFGDIFLHCEPTAPGAIGTRYEIAFQATSTSQTIKFTNWGHMHSSASEVILDDVKLITSSASPGVLAYALGQIGNGCDLTVQGTNQTVGGSGSYLWDMGDGTTYTTTDVMHTYAAPGTYDVTLYVAAAGCSPGDSLTQTITMLLMDTVDAAFSFTQTFDCNDLLVDCINTSVNSAATTYLWDMGDGTTYTTTDVIGHQYAVQAAYTISLIATDTSTCNTADTASITVSPTLPVPVTAAFTLAQVFDCAQLIVQGTNSSTGSNLAFAWTMGDGTTYADTNITHTYTTAGSYDVMLVVSDLEGCSPNDTVTVTVVLDPIVPIVAAFTLGQVGNCTLLTVQGLNLSTGDSVTYTWDMGDGTTYATQDVAHVYTVPGTYTVELLVTDLGCGNDDSLSTTVVVIDDLPIAAATNGVICPGLTTTIYASGAAGNTFLWSDGSTLDSLVVSAAGTYWVVVSNGLCTGSDTVDVIEAPEQHLSYGFDACPGAPITLTIPYEGTAYLWETGATEQSIYLLFPGLDTTDYDFEVWDATGCVHADSVTVTPMDSEPELYVPNAFTPDGDGFNDEFVISGFGEHEVELMIFNRWGEQIFKTTSLSDPWNGMFNGQIKQDVYVYKLRYNGECTHEDTSLIGHVTVLK